MKTVIVSAFPACGKSYVHDNQTSEGLTCLDSDSSDFSWIKCPNGKNTTIGNPEFPNNYIQHIKDNVGQVDIIFISSHEQVVAALDKTDLCWVGVTPHVDCRSEWVGRFWLRGNDDNFIKFINNNWDEFTKPNYTYNNQVGSVTLGAGNYIQDKLNFILNCTGN